MCARSGASVLGWPSAAPAAACCRPVGRCRRATSRLPAWPHTATAYTPRRFRSVALVSKRCQALCLAPQLLQSLIVSISRDATALQRSAALLQFLAAHAAHVQELHLNVEPADDDQGDAWQLSDSQLHELGEIVASALGTCAAAGALRLLRIGRGMPLASAAWLPVLRHLEKLRLGSLERPLRLPATVSQLTGLEAAALEGSPLVLEGPLPHGLTELYLADGSSNELPGQV